MLDRIEALEGDGNEVVITEVFSARKDETCELPDGTVPDTIDIRGVNFDRAQDATGVWPETMVLFGDFVTPLTLCPGDPENPTATHIKAALPSDVGAGDYLVTVSVGDAIGDTAEHLHTIRGRVRVQTFPQSVNTSCS